MDLSVITATHHRPALLGLCLQQFHNQSIQGLRCEHIVVSDGPDPIARSIAQHAHAQYAELDHQRGHAGAFCKDLGLTLAQGRYACFWDDDNYYAPHALATLYATVHDADIGVVQTQHRLRKRTGTATIPRRWQGQFEFGDVDTMCVCVRTDLARQEAWGDADASPGTDYRWLMKLMRHEPEIQFVPLVIGSHL